MERKDRPGRPPSVSVIVREQELAAADGNIKQFLKSKVRGSTRKDGSANGGYIPVPSEYGGHPVFIIVLDKDEEPK